MPREPIDYPALFDGLVAAVRASADAGEGWRAVLDVMRSHGGTFPADLDRADAGAEVASLRRQLQAVFAAEPIPPGTTFLYFGLFEAYDPDAERELAGYYVSGGTGDPEEEVAECRLPYAPEHRYLKSPLLDRVLAAERAEADDRSRQLLGYGLMLGAGSLLAKHATESIAGGLALVVGFDEGDFALVRGFPGA